MEELERLRRENEDLRQQVRALRQIVVDMSKDAPSSSSDSAGWQFLKSLTTKQHCVLQMLMGGQGGPEIAERLDVSENTARAHIKVLMAKAEVSKRAELAVLATKAMDSMGSEEYQKLTGIPKTWHQDFKKPDPLARLYAPTKKAEWERRVAKNK